MTTNDLKDLLWLAAMFAFIFCFWFVVWHFEDRAERKRTSKLFMSEDERNRRIMQSIENSINQDLMNPKF